ncbi:MAG: molybdenum cofactor guanylyltransferase [Acidimicrobiia bacterium]
MIGVVLAGGESRRMGTDKALAQVGGRSMISWVADALARACDRVLISGRPQGWEGHPGLGDPSDARGPLAGLLAALELGEPVTLVAVDQPWVRFETLSKLIEAETTAVPIENEIRQVTCAVYYPELAPLGVGAASLQALLEMTMPLEITEPVWKSWGEDGRSWFSVDRPEDIELGLRQYGPPGSTYS